MQLIGQVEPLPVKASHMTLSSGLETGEIVVMTALVVVIVAAAARLGYCHMKQQWVHSNCYCDCIMIATATASDLYHDDMAPVTSVVHHIRPELVEFEL